MCNETDLQSKLANKLNTAAWSSCVKRLFYDIQSFLISVCNAVSQFNGGGTRYHLKFHYQPINVTIEYNKQHQILLSLNKKKNNKLDIYEKYFQIKLLTLPMNQ